MSGKSHLLMHLLLASGVSALLGWRSRKHGVLVLAYHRIGDGRDCSFDRDVFSATPEQFDAQVKLLKQHYDVISPQDLAEAMRGRGRYAMITFDDGYRDNYEVAHPILKSHGVPATFLLSTGFLDRRRVSWWDEIAWMVRMSPRLGFGRSEWLNQDLWFDEPDRTEAIRRLHGCYKFLAGSRTEAFMDYLAEATGSGRYSAAADDTWMTWDMVRQMKASGMCIGGHTVDHPILSRLPREQQEREIADCRQRIEAELGQPMRFFSYPRGKRDSYNADTQECLRRQNVELAFSYYGGFQTFDAWQPYDVRRAAVEMDVDLEQFEAMVTAPGYFA